MSSRLPERKQDHRKQDLRASGGRRRAAGRRPAVATVAGSSAWLGDDRLFTPLAYEPGYDYPLLVWLPGHGKEEPPKRFDLARTMARVSLRNFVAIQPLPAADDPATLGWDDLVFRSIDRVRERLSIHRRRVFLVGRGSGGTEAFRIACRHPDAFAGVVSIGGPFPLDEGLFARIAEVRRLPMLLCCRQGGADDVRAAHVDRTLRLFHAAGASLAMRIYPGRNDLARGVLADVNRWVMDEVCGSPANVHSLSAS
jgi:phospholipase/carboxylesterase